MMKTFDEYLALVNSAIERIPYPARPANLYEPVIYTMAQGGKRIRPVLTLMACDAFGGDITRAMNPAVGLEMFHNFTLLHDDVMDNADIRRGQPTVHRRWGENVAILSGDAMLTMATALVVDVEPRIMPEAMRLFNQTAIEIYEGQQMDMDFEHRHDVTQEEYIEMIRLKTSVLLGCACRLGAIVAGADEDAAQGIYDVGVNLGIAFQLQDDWLDVWGDPATFGKQIGGDIMNNKKTFQLIGAIAAATGDDADELRRWLSDSYALRDMKVTAMTAIYERLGLKQRCREEIARYSALAHERLATVDLPDEAKQTFGLVIDTLVDRTK